MNYVSIYRIDYNALSEYVLNLLSLNLYLVLQITQIELYNE